MSSELERLVSEVKAGFERHGVAMTRNEYVALLMGQLQEAIQHADRGEGERFANEMADCVSIAGQAILAESHSFEAFVCERIRTKVIPKMEDGTIEAKYRLPHRGDRAEPQTPLSVTAGTRCPKCGGVRTIEPDPIVDAIVVCPRCGVTEPW